MGKIKENLIHAAWNPFASSRHSYSYEPLELEDKCIRLVRLHAGTGADPVRLEILKDPFNLDNPYSLAPYEALSYVWGSKENPVTVRMMGGKTGGSSFPITRNLHDALLHLRFPDGPRIMWIDAVCIDQDDVVERNAQVGIMGEIFARAVRVIAWLGPSAENSSRALDVLDEIGSQVDLNWSTFKMTPSVGAADRTLCDPKRALPYHLNDQQCIQRLIRRTWFERVWIRQEVGLAHDVAVCAGNRSISWEKFKTAIYCLYSKRGKADPFGMNNSRLALAFNVFRFGRHLSLDNLRNTMKHTTCEDPRDRVFGALGLLDDYSRAIGIKPDYSKSVQQVYTNIAVKIMTSGASLSLLSECDNQENKVPGLPTWVPDWSAKMSYTLPNNISEGGALLAPLIHYKGGGVIQMHGIDCGTVLQSERILGSSSSKALDSCYKACRRLNLCNNLSKPYVAGGAVLDAVVCSLFCGRFQDNIVPPYEYDMKYTDARQNLFILLTAPEALSFHRSGGEAFHPLLSERIANLNDGRRLFTTQAGHIGSGCSNVMPGDRVVLFLGSTKPMILRPTETGQFRVVGSCFLHGVMAGEPVLGLLPENIGQFRNRRGAGAHVCYRDVITGERIRSDPRFDMIAPEYERQGGKWKVGRFGTVVLEPEVMRRLGVHIDPFDLV